MFGNREVDEKSVLNKILEMFMDDIMNVLYM